MRTISVSTEVFAMIWAARQPGEESEDDILRRKLGGEGQKEEPENKAQGGFYDRRYDLHFQEGFEIFRTFLGKDYRARATGGTWLLLNNGSRYGGLNELSQAIGTKTENAWANWFFDAADGQRKPVSELRDPSKIHRRKARRPLPIPEVEDL